jgi:hypothetical protein
MLMNGRRSPLWSECADNYLLTMKEIYALIANAKLVFSLSMGIDV